MNNKNCDIINKGVTIYYRENDEIKEKTARNLKIANITGEQWETSDEKYLVVNIHYKGYDFNRLIDISSLDKEIKNGDAFKIGE